MTLLERIVEILPYKITLETKNHIIFSVDLSFRVDRYNHNPLSPYTQLQDSALFAQARINEVNGLERPNGVDICPDMLWTRSQQQQALLTQS